jgi:hypothetical protein
MNGLGQHQFERPESQFAETVWPRPVDAIKILLLRWKLLVLSVGSFLVLGLIAMRVLPKTYESVAVVSTRGSEMQNPASADKNKFKVFEREKLALDELRSSLFSYDIVKQAALESGVKLDSGLSLRDSAKRTLWSAVGGEISADPAARERVALDVLRFRHFTFAKLDARSVQDRLVERENNMYVVGMQYADPQIARLFLQRTLELYREKLAKDQAMANEKLTKIYEELGASLGKNIESLQGNPKVARQKLQTMDVLKDQLKAKLSEEAMLRNTSEQELALLRKDVVEAEARYSDKHPMVEALRRKYAEGASRAKAPIGRVQSEIASIRNELSQSFSELLQSSQGTFESSASNTEGHSEHLTKDRRELRSVSNVFETLRERYLEVIVQERISNMANDTALQIVEPASLPLRPMSPSMTKVLLLALVAGILFGFVAVFGIEIAEPTVKNRWALSLRTGLPIFGEQQKSLDAAIALLTESTSRTTSRAGSHLRRSLKRIVGKGKAGKASEKDHDDDAFSLSMLVTKLSAMVKHHSSVFQCGFMPVAQDVPSAGVAYMLAQQFAQKAGEAKVVIVAANRKDGVLSLLDDASLHRAGEMFVTDSGIAIVDATQCALDHKLASKLAAQGFQCIIWDLPAHDVLAWRGLDLPQMPLLGVLEYGDMRFSEIKDSARWLKLMASENGYSAGFFVAGTRVLPRVQLIDYISDKVA